MGLMNWFKRGKTQDDIWSIIKKIIVEYFKAESSSGEGRVNLIMGLILTALVFALSTTSIGIKLISLIKPDFKTSSLNDIEIFLMVVGVIIFFIYCMHKVTEVQKIKNSK